MPRQNSSPKQRYRQYRRSLGALMLLMGSLFTGSELSGQEATVTFRLTSPAFADGGDIPSIPAKARTSRPRLPGRERPPERRVLH